MLWGVSDDQAYRYLGEIKSAPSVYPPGLGNKPETTARQILYPMAQCLPSSAQRKWGVAEVAGGILMGLEVGPMALLLPPPAESLLRMRHMKALLCYAHSSLMATAACVVSSG